MRLAALKYMVCGALLMAPLSACKQVDGERCQIDSDCEDGLICCVLLDKDNKLAGYTCREKSKCIATDTGVPDSKVIDGGKTPDKKVTTKDSAPGEKTTTKDATPESPAPTCKDNKQNGKETDVDCGGVTCPACADGKGCTAGTDCTSKVCDTTATPTVCKKASCTDKVKNGDETDEDCGGATCAKCALGKECKVNGDCASGTCDTTKTPAVCK